MRFDELAYQVDGLTVTVPFHRTLTVVSGLDAAMRRGFAERVLSILQDGPESTGTSLVFIDGAGSRVHLVRDGRGHATLTDLETGEDLLHSLTEGDTVDLLAALGLEPAAGSRLMLLDPAALERDGDDTATSTGSAELAEAHEVLAQVQSEFDEVLAAYGKAGELRARLEEIDDQISHFDEALARRRHGQAAREVQRLEAELGLLTGTPPAERLAAEAALAAARAGDTWRSARDALAAARTAFGDRRRLDPRALSHALQLPVDAPAGLDALQAAYLHADRRRSELVAQLHEGTDSELPPPSAPWVLTLARIDHPDLWARAERLRAVRTRAAELSMGLGGTGQHREMVAELEVAHAAVEAAERAVDNAKVPRLALTARRRLAKAAEREHAVLTKVGFVSWLAFQMRRIDVLLEPDALESLRVAELEAQLAAGGWSELAGEVDPEAALGARAEVERYAEQLTAAVSDLEATETLRRELAEVVEPSYQEARAALMDACRPFDVEPEHATSEVAAIVSEARHARIQAALEDAEAAHDRAEAELETALVAAGLPGPGDLDDRVATVAARAAEAAVTLETPRTPRDRHEVEVELTAAQAELARFSRPEWDEEPLMGDDPLPDPDALAGERARLAVEIVDLERDLPDLDRLSDRRVALARRVGILEATSGTGSRLLSFEDAEMALLGRFAQARRVGPEAEPVPILIEDALAGFPRHDKWRLLDLLLRLGEASQVIYLTDDPDTAEWAAARARQGTASLLRPDPVASVA